MSFFSKLFGTKNQVREDPPRTTSPLFIIGLGNPGKKYRDTRHNFGWLAIDHLHTIWQASPWHLEKKFQAELSEALLHGRKVYLVKPQTFMNNSGESVQTLLSFHKATPKDIVVLHDEVDIPFGRIKTTLSSRAAGHNGVKDIIEKLGTQDFCRLRLGVGKPARNATHSVAGGSENSHISTADHVLQNFSEEEQTKLSTVFTEIEKLLKEHLN